MFPKNLRTFYVYSAAFWLVTRGWPGPNISRNERTHWQVAKASMARRRLGWESAEASATSLLQLPLMDGTFCCKALRWSTMKKQAVLVQIIYFPKLPKAGMGGKTRGVRSQCFTDTGCEELETFRWVFPGRASRDSRMEAWGDDCIRRASVGWGFPCGFVTWVQTNPRSNMTGTICDPGESCFDYLWLLGSITGLAPGFYESWDSWHAILVGDSSQQSFPKSWGQVWFHHSGRWQQHVRPVLLPEPYSQNGSRFTVSCCHGEFMCSESGILFCLWHGNPTSRHKGQKPSWTQLTSSGNQKEKRCLEQQKATKHLSRCGPARLTPKRTWKNIEILTTSFAKLLMACASLANLGELLEVLYDVVADPKTGRPRAENATSSVQNPCFFLLIYAQMESNGS